MKQPLPKKAIVIFFVTLLPILLIGTFSYLRARKDLTEYALSRRQTIAQIAAIALREKFDSLSELSISLASRVQFRRMVEQKRWADAIRIMEDVHKKFPLIERIFVTDFEGTLRADTPAIPEIKGINLSFRDWYQMVRGGRAPYVSNVYRRIAYPRYNVMAVATSIESDSGENVGILVLQLRTDRLFEWIKTVEVGPAGYIYIVDKAGNLAAHPRFLPQSEIMSYANLPVIKKALQGSRGVEVSLDPMEKDKQISAYSPVQSYGWAVIAQQPVVKAFALQEANLRLLIIAYSVIFTFTCIIAYLVLKTTARLFEVQAARAEAEKNARIRDNFVSAAAHELRTPLTAIKIQLQLIPATLQRIAFDGKEKFMALLQQSLRQLDQFSLLTDELLDVSRIDAGQLPLELRKVDLSELVRKAVDSCRSALQQAKCSVTLTLSPSIIGFWDPARIEQVILNLLSNAMKYGREGVIEIIAGAEGDTARLIVRDQGIGISKEDQEKLFHRFERPAPLSKYRGLGLGLYIAHEIVVAHGGSIRVDSKPGEGATFIVELPLPEKAAGGLEYQAAG